MRPRTGFDWTIFGLAGVCLGLNVVELINGVGLGYNALAAIGTFGVVALYLGQYRPVLPSGSPRPWWCTLLLVLCIGVATFGLGHHMVLQIAAHVLIWATMTTAVRAGLVSAAVSCATLAGSILGDLGGNSPFSVGVLAGMTGLAWFAALGYGLWIRHAQQDANEQAALVAELRATREALTAASRHAGQMDERARVSRELHDTLTQSVAAIALVAGQAKQARSVETVDLLHDMAQDALREARGVISVLAPITTAGDAAISVDGIVARFRRETQLPIEVKTDGVVVDAERELAIIRCLQEGLSNVRRHARATQAWVTLRRHAQTIELLVEDDGVGIAPNQQPGFGLRGMRDRVGYLDGGIELAPRQSGGTRLRVWIGAQPAESS